MKNLIGILVAVVVIVGGVWLLSGNEASSEVVTMNVAAEKQECTGVGPRECLVVNGELFYSSINGFDFEEGTEYTLEVRKTERENPPADASAFTYELVEVIDSVKVGAASTTDDQMASSSAAAEELMNSSWQWEETTYSDGETVAAESDEFVLAFEEGRFSATTDCNNVMGSYSASTSQVSFSQMASTKKACIGETQEAEFTGMLGEVQGYTITDAGKLALTLKFDSGSMIFAPTDAPSGN